MCTGVMGQKCAKTQCFSTQNNKHLSWYVELIHVRIWMRRVRMLTVSLVRLLYNTAALIHSCHNIVTAEV